MSGTPILFLNAKNGVPELNMLEKKMKLTASNQPIKKVYICLDFIY